MGSPTAKKDVRLVVILAVAVLMTHAAPTPAFSSVCLLLSLSSSGWLLIKSALKRAWKPNACLF